MYYMFAMYIPSTNLCATNDRVSFLPKVYTKLCIGSLGRAPSTAVKLSGSIKSSLQSNTQVEKVWIEVGPQKAEQ